jgi:hypothetical protein
MAIINLAISGLGLPTLALCTSSLLGSMPFKDSMEMESFCVVWTVIEQPVYINTCFASSTVATIHDYKTTIPGPTCIDITVTSSQTINPLTVDYTALTTDIYTTVCPSPTTFTYNSRIYTVTEATTITITGK